MYIIHIYVYIYFLLTMIAENTQIPLLFILSLGYTSLEMWYQSIIFRGTGNRPSLWGSITNLYVPFCSFVGIAWFFPFFI